MGEEFHDRTKQYNNNKYGNNNSNNNKWGVERVTNTREKTDVQYNCSPCSISPNSSQTPPR